MLTSILVGHQECIFLHGNLAEEVYIEQPLGFVVQGEFGLVCRLRHSLYDLKQSLELGLTVLAPWYRSLVLLEAHQITMFSIIIHPQGSASI